jgi:hypothetical protein
MDPNCADAAAGIKRTPVRNARVRTNFAMVVLPSLSWTLSGNPVIRRRNAE